MAPVRIRSTLSTLACLAITLAFGGSAKAQIAFAPVVNSFPNGVTLNATPVVSHDRRYVRMTLNPIFNSLQGFDAYSVPFAVSGQGGRGAGGGGLGGLGGGGLGGAGGFGGGGGGGAGGGFRSVTFTAGMNGVESGGGYPSSSYASAQASSILSGSSGYDDRPEFHTQPEVNPTTRVKAMNKPARTARSKKAAPTKKR